MHIQIVNFNLKNLGHDAYADFSTAIAPQFAKVPGLIAKTWLSDRDANTYGGVYLWATEAAMRDFAGSELFESVATNPSLANLTSRDFSVLETPSRVTNGLGSPAAVA